MKKGSQLVKCKQCGEPLYWRIPNGYLNGFIPEAKIKFIDGKTEIKKTKNSSCRCCCKCGRKLF